MMHGRLSKGPDTYDPLSAVRLCGQRLPPPRAARVRTQLWLMAPAKSTAYVVRGHPVACSCSCPCCERRGSAAEVACDGGGEIVCGLCSVRTYMLCDRLVWRNRGGAINVSEGYVIIAPRVIGGLCRPHKRCQQRKRAGVRINEAQETVALFPGSPERSTRNSKTAEKWD